MNIQFAVSAKTARLIGRENISGVDGAVIELIKNAYDADATCVFVKFDIPFPSIPQSISFKLATSAFGETLCADFFKYYQSDGKQFVKQSTLSSDDEVALSNLLFSCNSITVMDNGSGMNEATLRNAWMNIGTNDKEERKVSPGGRIKTGAKGIGRFALDKLSTATTVYTKSADDSFKRWEIDWRQFDTAIMLNEVTASIEDCTGTYSEFASQLAAEHIKSFQQYSWNTGTAIILHPTREAWSEILFSRINRNLKSLFPSSNDSQFDIYVQNVYYPKYSFENERFSLNENEYDYKIFTQFDGQDKLKINIQRNEIDTRKMKMAITVDGMAHEVLLSEFWARDAFVKSPYKRSDYAKTVEFVLSASGLTKLEPAIVEAIGPFQAELYFLKNTPSNVPIVKPVIASRRKEIFNNYSGIKLYRDGFKVRPYGEDGASFDWLQLGDRATKSPAGVSHESGAWRVRTNQIIGAVRISQESNPNLTDMANREGLAVNETYHAFVLLLDKIIETFEGDRQYVFREFASWTRAKEQELSVSSKLLQTLKEERSTQAEQEDISDSTVSQTQHAHHEYIETVLQLDARLEEEKRSLKTLMLYSSAGVMANTFSHEISRIATHMGSRNQHTKYLIKRLLGDAGYAGDPLFDPLRQIEIEEKTDNLLESWLNVIMSGVDSHAFTKQETNIFESTNKILGLWIPLLQQKLIMIKPIVTIGCMDSCTISIAETDLHIILNNFLLNSAWFLEKALVDQRQITITILDDVDRVVMLLENNGPPLDSMFSNDPERIFNAGESSKGAERGGGTGLGLWITRIVVSNNSGEIHVMDKNPGFGLRISFPK